VKMERKLEQGTSQQEGKKNSLQKIRVTEEEKRRGDFLKKKREGKAAGIRLKGVPFLQKEGAVSHSVLYSWGSRRPTGQINFGHLTVKAGPREHVLVFKGGELAIQGGG